MLSFPAVRSRPARSTARRRARAHTFVSLTMLAATTFTACVSSGHAPLTTPLTTDRPDFTESASTVATGHSQLELGQTLSQEADTRSIAVGEVLFRRGLSERFELRVAANSFAVERSASQRAEGLEDAGLGVKIALAPQREDTPRWRPSVSLIAGASVPTGSRPFRSRHLLPETKLIASWALAERVGFATNVNWAADENETGRHSEWSGSASLGVMLTSRWGTYAEYFGFGEDVNGWVRRDYVNGGVTFLVTPSLQLDGRVGVGPSIGRRDFFTGLGLSRRW